MTVQRTSKGAGETEIMTLVEQTSPTSWGGLVLDYALRDVVDRPITEVERPIVTSVMRVYPEEKHDRLKKFFMNER